MPISAPNPINALKNRKSSVEVKNRLIDNFLFWGAIFATIIFLMPVVAGTSDSSQIDFIADVINITLLYVLYTFRSRVPLNYKAFVIILTLYSFFLSDIYQHGIYSTVKYIIVFIPFVGILVFDLKKAIWMFSIAIISFAIIGYLYLTGLIAPIQLDPQVNSIVKWVNNGLVLSIVSVIISMFVHYYNQSLLAIIDEKNTLLQEIHHRVKNNLAVVSGLLDLQAKLATDDFSRSTLQLSTNRILSISKVHELLYQSDNVSRIHLEQYIRELAGIIIDSFNKTEHEIVLDLDINIPYLNVNHGVPVGIILNELITNSLKHGFNQPQELYQIRISAEEKDDLFSITYQDNGSGHIKTNEDSKPGLGKTLIDSLLIQIDAEHELSTLGMYKMSFQFPKEIA